MSLACCERSMVQPGQTAPVVTIPLGDPFMNEQPQTHLQAREVLSLCQ